MRCSAGFASVLIVLAASQFALAADKPEGGMDLFDGKSLTGWEHYLVEPDVKMADVWSVRDGLLICKGEPMGYLATKKQFTNFRLIVEWRWAPGKPAGNSGVLMRITGEPRALPKCVEAQLKAGSAGDIYGFHGFQVKGDAARSRSAEGELFGKLSGVSKIKGNEKEPGEWNKYDITLSGGDLTLTVNGKQVNQATGLDVVAGKIGLQSEGGEIHFRTARLIPLDNDVSSAEDPQPGVQVAAATEVTIGTGDSAQQATVHYLIALPEEYHQKDKCPLMIFLHGRGECGSDLNRVKIHGPPKNVQDRNSTSFIIVSPQSPQGEWWQVEKLSQLLDHILATTKADPERVYLTGLSMGGFGTWTWAAEEPQRFAAAIPICGGGNPKQAQKLVDLPIWAFHGAKDNVVALSKSEAMVDAIRAAGGKTVKLTVYPDANHDSWTKTYDNPEIYKWLLSQVRAK